MSNSVHVFQRLIAKIAPHDRVIRVWPLKGGYSADVTAVEVERPDGTRRKLVVRRHGAGNLTENPNVAADEVRLLAALQAAGLPVPQPLLVDASGELFPTPVIVVSFVDGLSEFAPPDPLAHAAELAGLLARVHAVNTADLTFLPEFSSHVARQLDRVIIPNAPQNERTVRATLAAAWPWQPVNPPVLLHGDFWPGNLLWRDGALAAIIDWEDAALGDPLADLGTARLELLWALGEPAMHAFTQRYQLLQPSLDYTNQPYWDLYAALQPSAALSTWGLDPATEARMRERLAQFVDRALAALG